MWQMLESKRDILNAKSLDNTVAIMHLLVNGYRECNSLPVTNQQRNTHLA